MWQCIRCRKKVDNAFDACWNCGTSSEGVADLEFRKAEEIRPEEMISPWEPNKPLPPADESTAIRVASDSMRETGGPRSTATAVEQWEYFYLSSREWRERVVAKCGYRWKLLLTQSARERFHNDQERAVEEVLNDLGSQGWEMVAMVPVMVTFLGSGGTFGSQSIFKRRIGVAAQHQSSKPPSLETGHGSMQSG
jgi:hypothetical protein